MMLRYFIIVVLFVQYNLCYGQDDRSKTQVDSTEIYLSEGKIDQALSFLDRVIAQDPTGDSYISRGLVRIEIGDLDGALQDLYAGLKLSPQNDTGYYNIGYILYMQSIYDEAIAYYDSALLVNPDDIYYRLSRADANLESEHYQLAENDYRKAIQKNPETDLGYFGIGLCHFFNKAYDSANYYISIAITYNPFDSEYYYQRSLCKYYLEDENGSIKDLNFALDLMPENLPALSARAQILIDNGLYSDAIEDLNSAISIDSLNLELLNSRGNILLFTDQYELARKDFSKIIEMNAEIDVAYYNRALSSYFLDQFDVALQDFGIAIMLNQQEEDYYSYRGLTQLALDKAEEALNDFSQALNINNSNPDIYFKRSSVFFAIEEYDAALSDLNTVFKLDPEFPGVFLLRADIYADLENDEEALKNYDLAILTNPQDGEVFFKRGTFLFEMDNFEGAMEDFNYAISIDKSMPAPYVNRGLLKLEMKDKVGACADWKRAFQLESEYAQELIKEHCR